MGTELGRDVLLRVFDRARVLGAVGLQHELRRAVGFWSAGILGQIIGIPHFALDPNQIIGQGNIPLAASGMPPLRFPGAAMMYFQFVFAAITPILIAGSVFARMNFKAWMIFVPFGARSSTPSVRSRCGVVVGFRNWARSTTPAVTSSIWRRAFPDSSRLPSSVRACSQIDKTSNRTISSWRWPAPASCGSAGTASTAATRTSRTPTPQRPCSTRTSRRPSRSCAGSFSTCGRRVSRMRSR